MEEVTNYKDIELENQSLSKEDEDIMRYWNDRFTDMDNYRNQYYDEWNDIDWYWGSDIQWVQQGEFYWTMPIEQSLIEMNMWLLPSKIPYEIKPNNIADVDIIQPAKAILDYFIYEKENFVEELSKWDYSRLKYWTWVLFCWLWYDQQVKYKLKDDNLIESNWSPQYMSTNVDRQVIQNIHIWIKNIKLQNFWSDETALNIQDAMDCQYQEEITIEEFRMRFLDSNWNNKPWYDYIKSVWATIDEREEYKDCNDVSQRRVLLYHYFNKLFWIYRIIANRKYPIYKWYLTFSNWELPFAVAQDYTNPDSFYWFWICHKIINPTAYIQNFLKSTMDWAWMNSWKAIIMQWNNTIEDMWLVSGTTSIWKLSWPQNGIQTFETNINIQQNIEVIKLLQDWIIRNTWVINDPMMPMQADTATQATLVEEKQFARLKITFDNRNIALDRALTIMLWNIKEFAPKSYVNYLFSSDGKIKDTQFLTIRVDNTKIKKENWKYRIDLAQWETWFITLDDKVFKDTGMMKVKVETPTTMSFSKSLEKAQFIEFMGIYNQMLALIPEWERGNYMSPEQLMDYVKYIWWYDTNKMMYNSKERQNKEEILWIIEQIKNIDNIWQMQQVTQQMQWIQWQQWQSLQPNNINNVPMNNATTRWIY